MKLHMFIPIFFRLLAQFENIAGIVDMKCDTQTNYKNKTRHITY